MAQRKTLTERQIEVLRWISDGCPDGAVVREDHSERISAGALRNRGLVTTKGTGVTWRAAITKAGRDYLATVDGPTPPIPRAAAGSASQELINELIAAGGTLRLPRTPYGYRPPGQPDYERRAAIAERNGKVPVGKRLLLTRTRGELRIDLLDAPPGTPTEARPVPIPGRVGRYHPVVAELRDAHERHEVSRAQLPRVLRILHGLVVEAERRGFRVAAIGGPAVSTLGKADWSGDRDGHLRITVEGIPVALRVREDGVSGRAVYPRYHGYGDDLAPARRSIAHEESARGTVRISILEPRSRSNRQSSWGDGKKQRLEDTLPALLMEVETLAAEEADARRVAEAEAERRQRAWEAAIERATERRTEHHRAEVLLGQVGAWRQAQEIRAFCDAIELERSDDPDALAWSAWARAYSSSLDPLHGDLAIPVASTTVSRGELRPFLDGWDPYTPDRGGWLRQ